MNSEAAKPLSPTWRDVPRSVRLLGLNGDGHRPSLVDHQLENAKWTPRKSNRRTPMIDNRICTVALTVASAIIGSTASAIAAPYDGNWSVVAQTTRGHCETIQFGLAISGGRIYSSGGSYGGYSAQMGGRVSPSGHVRVNAVAGPRTANGAGRLGRYQGGGTWAGQGPSGVCSGVWSAYRSRF
jgi:hypothetical protein